MDLPGLSLTWIISVSATVLLLTYFWFSRRNPKYPPCPLRPWPIVGNLLQLDRDPREQFAGFRKQCGDIYSLYFGPRHVVIINGLDVLKEAFVKQGDDFSVRAVIFVDIATNSKNKGIFATNGAAWKEHRIFSTLALKNLGIGSNILAEKIQEEVRYYMELLDGLKGVPTDTYTFLDICVSNIMCSIVVGQRYEHGDKDFRKLMCIMKLNVAKMQKSRILNYFPWLRFLPGDLFGCKIMEKNFREFFNIFALFHMKENNDVVGEPGNYIAAYLQEMKKKEVKGEQTHLDKRNLLRAILDLFLAGTETTTNTLAWFFLYMVNYPDVQEKLYNEIKDVVGLERAPVLQDRSKLTYMTAAIMEVQRIASLVPLSLPRVLLRDVDLLGYTIPCGAEVMVNNDSILHDPNLWGVDANTFRPGRFINADGSLRSHEAWVPFSLGRRACLGESLANMELFLFVANILQRFHISPADPTAVPPIKGFFGMSHNPLPYSVRFIPRMQDV